MYLSFLGQNYTCLSSYLCGTLHCFLQRLCEAISHSTATKKKLLYLLNVSQLSQGMAINHLVQSKEHKKRLLCLCFIYLLVYLFAYYCNSRLNQTR